VALPPLEQPSSGCVAAATTTNATVVEFGNGRGQMMLQVLSLVSGGKGA
jgi:SAM-dependent MidA family methyltransferase